MRLIGSRMHPFPAWPNNCILGSNVGFGVYMTPNPTLDARTSPWVPFFAYVAGAMTASRSPIVG